MITELYTQQLRRWPTSGQHILAQFDEESILVYQAYRPEIAQFAVEHQRFGGEFSFGRMSWIKPNFLWMMYRSGWASKAGQTQILAISLRREFFDELLAAAIASSFEASHSDSRDDWAKAVANSDVRIQWGPDHDPKGRPLQRRAVQLGLRGETLNRYGREALLSVEDVTPFVTQQRENLAGGEGACARQPKIDPLRRVIPSQN